MNPLDVTVTVSPPGEGLWAIANLALIRTLVLLDVFSIALS